MDMDKCQKRAVFNALVFFESSFPTHLTSGLLAVTSLCFVPKETCEVVIDELCHENIHNQFSQIRCFEHKKSDSVQYKHESKELISANHKTGSQHSYPSTSSSSCVLRCLHGSAEATGTDGWEPSLPSGSKPQPINCNQM